MKIIFTKIKINEEKEIIVKTSDFGNDFPWINAMLCDRILDDVSIEDKDDLYDALNNEAWEYADGSVPVYTYDVNNAFSVIPDWEIDDLCNEYCIEYSGEDFGRFKMSVIFAKYHEEIQSEISALYDIIVDDTDDEELLVVEQFSIAFNDFVSRFRDDYLIGCIEDGKIAEAISHVLSDTTNRVGVTPYDLCLDNLDCLSENKDIITMLEAYAQNPFRFLYL